MRASTIMKKRVWAHILRARSNRSQSGGCKTTPEARVTPASMRKKEREGRRKHFARKNEVPQIVFIFLMSGIQYTVNSYSNILMRIKFCCKMSETVVLIMFSEWFGTLYVEEHYMLSRDRMIILRSLWRSRWCSMLTSRLLRTCVASACQIIWHTGWSNVGSQ